MRSGILAPIWITTLTASLLVAPPIEAQTAADTTWHCYVPGSGTVYRIKASSAPTSCVDSSHVQFFVNAAGRKGDPGTAGPVGPKGDTGPAGPQGPAGASGSSGVSGLIIVTATSGICRAGNVDCGARPRCPAGKKVVGGGASGAGDGFLVTKTAPDGDAGWFANGFSERTGATWTVTGYAICATVTN